MKILLNPNRKTYGEYCVKTCEEMLHAMNAETQVQVELEGKDRSRIKYVDKDMNCIMKKVGNKVEGKVIGIKNR